MKQIQWYPGHMAKTKRQIKEVLRVIDIVLELRDARIPFSSRNPLIKEIIGDKPRILLLNKADMVEQSELNKWIDFYEKQGIPTLKINALTGKGIDEIKKKAQIMLKVQVEKELKRGRKTRPIRAMILGIPNVGKSTLINRLAKKNKLVVENRAGVTKKLQYIRVGEDFELLDTPGILWPKFDDDQVALKLALTGAIKDNILPIDEVVIFAMKYCYNNYKNLFEDRYNIKMDIDDILKIYDDIGRNRGCLLPGNQIDYDRVNDIVINEVRGVKLGKMIFDRVDQDV